MKTGKKLVLLMAMALAVFAQSPEPPVSETRLSIHTLVREDIFAGFLQDDLTRLERGEKNVKALLASRPAEKSSLLAWQAGATLYRAVHALENNKQEEFQQKYAQAQELFAQAKAVGARDGGAEAVTGGSMVLLADKLPKELRAAAWQQSYEAFQTLWKAQGAVVEKLPVHIRGELLGGLAVSAQRTGRKEEAAQHLDRIETVMADTPYAKVAKQWKANPAAMQTATITCLTCHESGRLAARVASLTK